MIEISGDGVNWKDWKPSTLLFDGYFVKDGVANTQMLVGGFDNGSTVTQAVDGYHHYSGTKSSKFNSYINVKGYESLNLVGSYSTYIEGTWHSDGYYLGAGTAKTILTVALKNGTKILEKEYGKITIAEKNSPKSASGNFNENVDLSQIDNNDREIMVTISCYVQDTSAEIKHYVGHYKNSISLKNAIGTI